MVDADARSTRPYWLSYVQEGQVQAGLSLVGWFDLCSGLNAHGLLMRYSKQLVAEAPNAVARNIAMLRERHKAKMLARLSGLEAVVKAAGRYDVRLAVIKGMATSHVLYNDAFARDFGDTDILVHSDDLPRIDWVLRQLGWVQPLEAYKARRLLEQGELNRSGLQGLASPFSVRSSTFLPHVSNYYYVHRSGQIDSMEVHDRFHCVDQGAVAGLIWSGRELELSGVRCRALSDEAAFVVSALSLHDDAEGVRSNTSERGDLGLKTCVDVHEWLRVLDERGALGRARSVALRLGVEKQLAVAMSCVCEVFRSDGAIAEKVASPIPGAWSMPYLERSLHPKRRFGSSARDLRRAFACAKERFPLLSLSAWEKGRSLPACGSESGLFRSVEGWETGFRLRVEARSREGVRVEWGMPSPLARLIESLCLQLVLVSTGENGERSERLGTRVNAFFEAGTWESRSIALGPGAVDGHANKVRRGSPCDVRASLSDGFLQLEMLLHRDLLCIGDDDDLGDLAVIPSVNERIAGQLFRLCAGWDFVESAECVMGMAVAG